MGAFVYNHKNKSYFIGDFPLSKVKQVRDLGFLINKDLCFTSHCIDVANRVERRLNQLFRALLTKDPIVLINAYKTYVKPLLEYGTVAFAPHIKKNILRLEKSRIVSRGKYLCGRSVPTTT
ncbi:hypothetical protein Y032_0004g1799 [Ancylostoma ceylanicum]|uniref:Uncharacterized protein n=1 Tax=Ancylostoma ceylanicum TaxID=53326 RepID=A0A016VU23_9BILA|nr:hypothetical protein Y032_0004g1799 [Ancylostoma ceylanicum]